MQSPTIQQVQDSAATLAAAITAWVNAFETENPGAIVHSLPVFPATKTTPVAVHVKVQIGQ